MYFTRTRWRPLFRIVQGTAVYRRRRGTTTGRYVSLSNQELDYCLIWQTALMLAVGKFWQTVKYEKIRLVESLGRCVVRCVCVCVCVGGVSLTLKFWGSKQRTLFCLAHPHITIRVALKNTGMVWLFLLIVLVNG